MTQNAQQVAHMDRADTMPADTVTNGANAMTAIFERAAFDQEFPLERLEKMMEMQERWQDRQAEKAFNDALASAQRDMPIVARNKHNSQTNSKYADLAAVNSAIQPVYSKNGFAPSFSTFASDKPDHYGVRCDLSHEAGHSRKYEVELPSDGVGIKGSANKTAIHAFGSTMSYGQRYLLCMIFNVATGDDDGQKSSGVETLSPEQVKELDTLLETTGGDKAAFLKMGGVERLEDIRAEQFEPAKSKILEGHRRRAAQAAQAAQNGGAK